MNGGGQTANRRLRQLIVDTRAESAAGAADSQALSTMAWNQCPRSMEYSADTLLKNAGTYVDCYRFHADILDGRGDWPAAQKAYAEGAALAPNLPAAYYSWGIALAKHGDLAGAVANLSAANQRGPHWADPLKAWGDVLARQGNTKGALAKYDESLKYAPNWKQLKEAREATAKVKT